MEIKQVYCKDCYLGKPGTAQDTRNRKMFCTKDKNPNTGDFYKVGRFDSCTAFGRK